MSWDYKFEVEDEDNLDNFQQFTSDIEGTVIIIDVTKSLFDQKITSDDENSTKISYFEAVMRGCTSIAKNKALTSAHDCVAFLFCHVKNASDKMMKFVHVFKNLEPPSIESIKQLMEIEKMSEDDFDDKFGLNDEGSIYHALWCSQTLFAKSKKKFGSKQIMLFTSDDDPSYKNEEGKKALLVKSRDLRQANIHLELIPIANADFQFDKFYKSIISANLSEENSDVITVPDTESALEQLMRRIRHKQYRKRSLGKLEWCLGGSQLKLGISVYNLVRPTPPPSTIKLDRDSNIEVIDRRTRVLKDTEQTLMPFDLKQCIRIAGKPICFETDELRKMKAVIEPGLNLIGFKPMKFLKSHYQIRAAQFIYPDESVIQGSARLFAAILHKCADRNLFALCSYLARKNAVFKMVALVPQLEKLNEKGDQIKPPGFHVIFLPFSDDIRTITLSPAVEVSAEDKAMCRRLTEALGVEYEPECILNPSLQKKLAVIEAMALEYENVETTPDDTLVNCEEVNAHCGEVLNEFKSYFKLGNVEVAAKKKAVDVSSYDLANLVKKGELDKLTVPQLKALAAKNNINLRVTRKKEIIEEMLNLANA